MNILEEENQGYDNKVHTINRRRNNYNNSKVLVKVTLLQRYEVGDTEGGLGRTKVQEYAAGQNYGKPETEEDLEGKM